MPITKKMSNDNSRHVILALALAAYAVAGMFMFHAIEVPFERQVRQKSPCQWILAKLWKENVYMPMELKI